MEEMEQGDEERFVGMNLIEQGDEEEFVERNMWSLPVDLSL